MGALGAAADVEAVRRRRPRRPFPYDPVREGARSTPSPAPPRAAARDPKLTPSLLRPAGRSCIGGAREREGCHRGAGARSIANVKYLGCIREWSRASRRARRALRVHRAVCALGLDARAEGSPLRMTKDVSSESPSVLSRGSDSRQILAELVPKPVSSSTRPRPQCRVQDCGGDRGRRRLSPEGFNVGGVTLVRAQPRVRLAHAIGDGLAVRAVTRAVLPRHQAVAFAASWPRPAARARTQRTSWRWPSRRPSPWTTWRQRAARRCRSAMARVFDRYGRRALGPGGLRRTGTSIDRMLHIEITSSGAAHLAHRP